MMKNCDEEKPFQPQSSLNEKRKEEERETWKNESETFLSALGAVVGLGNIWRFPYITYQYGGGAFLIPYVLFALCCGIPMFFLETSLGQYTRINAIDSWNIIPIMKGVGIGSVFLALYFSLYYITVMAWALNYFYHTLRTTDLPWIHCDNWFNTNSCITYHQAMELNVTGLSGKENKTLPIVEFWNKFILRKSDTGLESIGQLDNWPMIICMFVAWAMIYFCLWRGTKWTGKIIYFTSLFPYLILLVLLVKGCTLPGALSGIDFYLKPNITQLARAEVWVHAASQVCYSYAICFACLITYGSYSDFNSDCYKRTFFLSTACSGTSFIAGFSVFAVLGNMAQVLGVEVKDVVKSGPGLAFLTYPTALSLMPAPQFWNACFFFMLILLAVDSQFCSLEGFLCVFSDKFEWARKNRELFVGLVCVALFLCGLLFVTPGGIYIFEIFNTYAVGGITLLWLVLWQSIAIGWVYGSRRYYYIVEKMIGYFPSPYMDVCFRFISPAATLFVLVFYFCNYEPLTMNGYEYPLWANVFGWVLCMSSFLCVPGWAIFEVYRGEGSLAKRLHNACKSRISVPEPEVSTKKTMVLLSSSQPTQLY